MPSVPSISSSDAQCSLCGSSPVHQEDDGYLYCFPCWKGEDYSSKYKDDPYKTDYHW